MYSFNPKFILCVLTLFFTSSSFGGVSSLEKNNIKNCIGDPIHQLDILNANNSIFLTENEGAKNKLVTVNRSLDQIKTILEGDYYGFYKLKDGRFFVYGKNGKIVLLDRFGGVIWEKSVNGYFRPDFKILPTIGEEDGLFVSFYFLGDIVNNDGTQSFSIDKNNVLTVHRTAGIKLNDNNELISLNINKGYQIRIELSLLNDLNGKPINTKQYKVDSYEEGPDKGYVYPNFNNLYFISGSVFLALHNSRYNRFSGYSKVLSANFSKINISSMNLLGEDIIQTSAGKIFGICDNSFCNFKSNGTSKILKRFNESVSAIKYFEDASGEKKVFVFVGVEKIYIFSTNGQYEKVIINNSSHAGKLFSAITIQSLNSHIYGRFNGMEIGDSSSVSFLYSPDEALFSTGRESLDPTLLYYPFEDGSGWVVDRRLSGHEKSQCLRYANDIRQLYW